ncbi:MAG: CPBP family intramembrane metalloprotease [Lentisphaeria bacterium]|nr:CPBP family intramembrane metalloprotease [Lentisphaeria bacterium]NQZ71362.1 CPBP family intramembrane metalloprotease [Lentisphaeria bacterium]
MSDIPPGNLDEEIDKILKKNKLHCSHRVIFFILSFYGIYILSGFVVGAITILYVSTTGNVEEMQNFVPSEKTVAYGNLLVGFPLAIICFILYALFRKFLDKEKVFERVSSKKALTNSICGFICGATPILLIAALLIFACDAKLTASPSVGVFTLVSFICFIPLGFIEELIFRGYIQRMLDEEGYPVIAIATSAILFWVVHGMNPEIWSSPLPSLNLFLAGVLFCVAYKLTGSLIFVTVMHFAWNQAQGPLLGIPVSGLKMEGLYSLNMAGMQSWLSGGKFGLEGSLATSFILITMILIFSLLLHMRQRVYKKDLKVES